MSLNKIFVNNTQVTSVDDAPISNSDNLVKSSGIYDTYNPLIQQRKYVGPTTDKFIEDNFSTSELSDGIDLESIEEYKCTGYATYVFFRKDKKSNVVKSISIFKS